MGWLNTFNQALVHRKEKSGWNLEEATKELSVIPGNVLNTEERDLILRLYKAEDDKLIAREALEVVLSSYWAWVNSDR